MLVLTRKIGEMVRIQCPSGEVVVVQVLPGRSGQQVKLGFDAPKSVVIVRDELNVRAEREPPCAG